jgi:hypothetical protein
MVDLAVASVEVPADAIGVIHGVLGGVGDVADR